MAHWKSGTRIAKHSESRSIAQKDQQPMLQQLGIIHAAPFDSDPESSMSSSQRLLRDPRHYKGQGALPCRQTLCSCLLAFDCFVDWLPARRVDALASLAVPIWSSNDTIPHSDRMKVCSVNAPEQDQERSGLVRRGERGAS